MIYYSAASSSLKKRKKKTDLKRILSHDLCFSVERRVIFPLEMWNVRIIFPVNLLKQRTKANLHTKKEVTFIVDKKKTQGKAITKFSPDVFKRPTFKGSNDI